MARATTTAALRRAVIAALTKPRSSLRALPAALLFSEARPADAAQRAGSLIAGPTAWVVIRDHAAIADRLLPESSDLRAIACTVEITCDYYGGNDLFSAEYAKAIELIEDHRVRVIDALLDPGALLTDPDGVETGLDGDGCLRFDGYRSTGPDIVTGKARVLRVVHFFRATLEVAKRSS